MEWDRNDKNKDISLSCVFFLYSIVFSTIKYIGTCKKFFFKLIIDVFATPTKMRGENISFDI